MKIPTIADGETSGGPMLDQIRRTAELRLRQIEPLIAEAEQLRDVIDAIKRGSPRAGGHANGGGTSSLPRAAKGANKRVILELVSRRPGITPAEIAAATGMKRTVAASTVSRLKRQGELSDHEQGGLCVAAELPIPRAAGLVAVQ